MVTKNKSNPFKNRKSQIENEKEKKKRNHLRKWKGKYAQRKLVHSNSIIKFPNYQNGIKKINAKRTKIFTRKFKDKESNNTKKIYIKMGQIIK